METTSPFYPAPDAADPPDHGEAKRRLRNLVRDRIRAMPAPVRAAADGALSRRALAWSAAWLAENRPLALAYRPLADEPALEGLLDAWRRRGVRLAFPAGPAPPDGSAGEPRFVDARGRLAGTGAIVLVPGRAFAPDGSRLGRGGGWYDRWLERARPTPAVRLALAYDGQVFDSVPAGPRDQPVTHLLTPTRGWAHGRPAGDIG